jgi:hypothetical protein
LDVQAAELDIMRSGTATLAKAEVVQLKAPLVPYNEDARYLQDAIAFMGANDFSLFDIAGSVGPLGPYLYRSISFLYAANQGFDDYFQFKA